MQCIVTFDTPTFLRYCSRSSTSYKEELCDFELIRETLFVVGQVWSSRKLLNEVLTSIGNLEGWATRFDNRLVCCNRRTKTRKINKHAERKLRSAPLETGGCGMFLRLKPLSRVRGENGTYKEDMNQPCVITEAQHRHSGTCAPSAMNLVTAKKGAATIPNFFQSVPSTISATRTRQRGNITRSHIDTTPSCMAKAQAYYQAGCVLYQG